MIALQKHKTLVSVGGVSWTLGFVGLAIFSVIQADSWFVEQSSMPKDYAAALAIACLFALAFLRQLLKFHVALPFVFGAVALLSMPSVFGMASVSEQVVAEYIHLVVDAED